MRLLSTLTAPGPRQMSLDEALLEVAGEPTVRLYHWSPPAVSLGCFQDHALIAPQLPSGMDVVRRITGGGAIWHQDEVTYSVVGVLGEQRFPARSQDLYAPLHAAVMAELHRRGATVALQPERVGDKRYREEPRCFASPAQDDLVQIDGGKVLGSAARARGQRVLLHGSLKLASNPWDGDVVSACGLDAAGASAAMLAAIATVFGDLVPGTLTAVEEETAARIHQQRYGTTDWVERRVGPRP